MMAPSPFQEASSKPQRSAATSRASDGVPSSLRTHRMSVLVTTQMKVSSGRVRVSGVSRNSMSASSACSCDSGPPRRERLRTGERRIVGKSLLQRRIDLGEACVDHDKARAKPRFGVGTAASGLLSAGCDQAPVLGPPLGHDILALAYQAGEPIAFGLSRGHLRKRLRGLRALRPLGGQEHATGDNRLARAVGCSETVGGPDRPPEAGRGPLGFALAREFGPDVSGATTPAPDDKLGALPEIAFRLRPILLSKI